MKFHPRFMKLWMASTNKTFWMSHRWRMLLWGAQKTMDLCCIHSLLLIANSVCLESSFISSLSNDKIYANSKKKNWHSYVKEYISKVLEMDVTSCRSGEMVLILQFIQRHSLWFFTNKYSIKRHSKERTHNNSHSKFCLENTASGQITMTGSDMMVSQFFQNESLGHYEIYSIWWFKPDIRLSFKLSFEQLYFLDYRNNCQKGNVKVFQLGKANATFEFCGINSPFQLYPSIPHMDIRLTFLTGTTFRFSVHAYYSVMDSNVLSTLSTLAVQQKPAEFSLFLVHMDFYIHSISIQVSEIFFVVLRKFNLSSQFSVYDGPGLRSEVIKQDRNIFNMSFFQCIIQLHTDTLLKGDVQYYSKTQISTVLKVEDYNELLISDINCTHIPCVFQFYSISCNQNKYHNK